MEKTTKIGLVLFIIGLIYSLVSFSLIASNPSTVAANPALFFLDGPLGVTLTLIGFILMYD